MVRTYICAWLLIPVLTLVASGCRSPYHADRDAFAGGLLGSGIGAVIGHQSGNTAEGAIVGGLAGALVGNAVGEDKDYIEARNRQLIEQQMGQAVRVGTVSHDDVIAMSQSGVGDDLIATHIRHHGVTHPPSSQDLIRLNGAGVSDSVVKVMQEPPMVAAAPPAVSGPPVIVEEHYYGAPYRPRHHWHHGHRHRRHHAPHWGVGVSFGH